MTTSLNTISRQGIAANMMFADGASLFTTTTGVLRIYPSTVPFPTAAIDSSSSLPVGSIVSFTGVTYTYSGFTITATAGALTANATANGTLAWWSYVPNGGGGGITHVIVSDSLSLNGGTGIVFISNSGASLSVTSGQTQTMAFNLQLS